MAYLTPDEYKAFLTVLVSGEPSYTEAEEAMLATVLEQAQTKIEEVTGRWFEAREQTRLFDAGAQVYSDPKLLLVDADLLEVTELKNGDGAVILPTSYWLSPLNESPHFGIRLKSSARWNFGNGHDGIVSVTGKWGYTAEPSEAIKRLTARLARYYETTRGAGGNVNVLEDGTRVYEAAMPADVRDDLRFYRRRVGNNG